MTLMRLRVVLPAFFMLMLASGLMSCGDDDDNGPTGNVTKITSYDEVFEWSCEVGASCQDVFDVEFSTGTVVSFSATETTGGSVAQIALYAPGTVLGGTNMFTDDTTELLCNLMPNCSQNTAGQTVSDFTIPGDGVYRLAVTRNWGMSCGGDGTYRLLINADKEFTIPSQSVDDVATLASGTSCPAEDALVHDEVFDWACASGASCQDVFDVEFTAGSTVTFEAKDTTGGSVLEVALYAPGTALGGTNLWTGDTTELRCNFVAGCGNNTAGQTVSDFVIPADGVYRFAVTRDWGNSCGSSGTYHVVITSDTPIVSFNQSVNDVATQAAGTSCP